VNQLCSAVPLSPSTRMHRIAKTTTCVNALCDTTECFVWNQQCAAFDGATQCLSGRFIFMHRFIVIDVPSDVNLHLPSLVFKHSLFCSFFLLISLSYQARMRTQARQTHIVSLPPAPLPIAVPPTQCVSRPIAARRRTCQKRRRAPLQCARPTSAARRTRRAMTPPFATLARTETTKRMHVPRTRARRANAVR
jgi:hypothetical protein